MKFFLFYFISLTRTLHWRNKISQFIQNIIKFENQYSGTNLSLIKVRYKIGLSFFLSLTHTIKCSQQCDSVKEASPYGINWFVETIYSRYLSFNPL